MGVLKILRTFFGPKKPMHLEFSELKKTLKSYLESAFGEERVLNGGWLGKIRQKIGTFNLYGRMVTKKAKGCSYFYELLNAKAKSDGWILPEPKLLSEMADFKNDLHFENKDYMRFVKEILKMPYLNRLKQFLLRLLRNNLFLGKRIGKCYIVANIRSPESCYF